jgi:hypothetical protein
MWAKDTIDPKNDIHEILDEANFTEIFRRLSGFLAMVSQMLNPLLPAADGVT